MGPRSEASFCARSCAYAMPPMQDYVDVETGWTCGGSYWQWNKSDMVYIKWQPGLIINGGKVFILDHHYVSCADDEAPTEQT